MGYEERKNKRKNKKKVQKYIGIAVFLYFLINSTSVLSFNNRLISVEDTMWYEQLDSKAILIKEEDVVIKDDNREKEGIIEEGDRVALGSIVMNSQSSGTGSLEKELEEVKNAIKSLDGIKESEKDDENESLAGNSLESLENKKKILTEQINSKKKAITSNISGIVSYNLDGYEEVFIPKEFENYKYSKLINIVENIEEAKERETKGLKVINNFQWYMALLLESNIDIENFEINNRINIRIEDKDLEIVGKIIEINQSDEGNVLIIQSNQQLHNFYNLRFTDVSIILSSKEAYKIPSRSIIKRNGQDGVLTKGFNGIIRFRPIKVLGKEKAFSIIDKGGENGYININNSDEEVRTVSQYEEIIIRPSSIRDGEILD